MKFNYENHMKKLLTLLLLALLSTVVHATPIKSLHFVLRNIPIDKGYWLVDTAKSNGFNSITIQITDGVQLDNEVWVHRSDAWTKQDFITWVNYTKSIGLDIIPEVKLLTHQDKTFAANIASVPPMGIMYNRNTTNRSTLTYSLVLPLIDEIVTIIKPTRFNIGHDELAGFSLDSYNKWLANNNESALPASTFLNDVIYLNNYLNSKGITTIMWADMLLNPTHFPTMVQVDMNGGYLAGYGKALRTKIPKNIILGLWHYYDNKLGTFPTVDTLRAEGFNVMGAVWNYPDKYAAYASTRGVTGMVATTWSYVQTGDWVNVERIIVNSGKAFNKYFI